MELKNVLSELLVLHRDTPLGKTHEYFYSISSVNIVIQNLVRRINELESKSGVDESQYLTRKQCAERLHITLPTLHAYINQGVLTAYKIGRRTLFKASDVDNALSLYEQSKLSNE